MRGKWIAKGLECHQRGILKIMKNHEWLFTEGLMRTDSFSWKVSHSGHQLKSWRLRETRRGINPFRDVSFTKEHGIWGSRQVRKAALAAVGEQLGHGARGKVGGWHQKTLPWSCARLPLPCEPLGVLRSDGMFLTPTKRKHPNTFLP